MKKVIYLIFSIILLFYINACGGYKPIFGSKNFNFVIEDHSTKGDERLVNLIYKKLYNASIANQDKKNAKSISLTIETNKEKKATVKNSTGKILEYQIKLNTNIIINDYLTNKSMLNQNFNYSISYKVQDEHSETLKLENKNIENLVNKTYQDALIKISEVVTSQ